VRIPTFSRHSSTDTADHERPMTGPATVTRPTEDTTTRWVDNSSNDQTLEMPRADGREPDTRRRVFDNAGSRDNTGRRDTEPAATEPAGTERAATGRALTEPAITGPKPRASLLATLGLIGGVAAALLVLSGPLLPYGIGLAVLALILSVSGMHATGRRHVAGKTDALIGMMLSLAAIVVGVLALTGSLSWLGTDMQPVTTLRQWLDAHTVNRF
jgi:hypothetical protein